MSDSTLMAVCAAAALVMLACPALLLANEHAQRDVPAHRAPTRQPRRWHMPQWSFFGWVNDWWAILAAYAGASLVPAVVVALVAPDGLEWIRRWIENEKRREGLR